MAKKYTTQDGKVIKIKVEPYSEETHDLLVNTVPRLTLNEILEGELERRLEGCKVTEIKESTGDIKNLILSYAVFNAVSKRP